MGASFIVRHQLLSIQKKRKPTARLNTQRLWFRNIFRVNFDFIDVIYFYFVVIAMMSSAAIIAIRLLDWLRRPLLVIAYLIDVDILWS